MSDAAGVAITVLSAGAVEPGLVKVIDAYRDETGDEVKITFATAPQLLKRISSGETADVVVAPTAALDELVKTGKGAAAERVAVGRIGVGVAVRESAPSPKIATVDEFIQSLLSAESVVYNQASTGIYIEKLFNRLGLAEQLKAKTTRYPDFAAVLNHVIKGKGDEIALGAATVIIEAKNKGLKLVGPLPAEIQNYTTYAASVTADGRIKEAGREFVRYLATPAAKAVFAAAGIE